MRISFAQALLTLAIALSPQVLAQKEKLPAEVVVVNSAESPIPIKKAAPVIGRDVGTMVMDCSVSMEQEFLECDPQNGFTFENDVNLLWIQARALSNNEDECEGAIGIGYAPPGPPVLSELIELLSVYAPGKRLGDFEEQFGGVGSESIVFPVPLQVLAANSELAVGFLSGEQPRASEWECKFRFTIAFENL